MKFHFPHSKTCLFSLLVCATLPLSFAQASDWTGGNTAALGLNVYGDKGRAYVSATESGKNLYPETGVNGYVTVESDHYVVHLNGGGGLRGLSCEKAGIEIRLSGDNTLICPSTETHGPIWVGHGLKIAGPGTLTIYNGTAGHAIQQGASGFGKIVICNGASVAVNCLNEAYGCGFFANGDFELRNAVLHVNVAANHPGITCDWNSTELSVESSVLTIISRGYAFVGGAFRSFLSNVHLSSTDSTALSVPSETASVSSSVLTLDGSDYGLECGSASFNNVVGVVSGFTTGIYGNGSVFVDGAATDLAVIGNLDAGNVLEPVNWLFGPAISMCSFDGPETRYVQKAGKVRLFSPGNAALHADDCSISGGTLQVGGGVSWSDLRKTYTLAGAASALEAGIGYSLCGKSWQFTDDLLANMFTGAFNATYALFKTADARPAVGIAADTIAATGGTVSVGASQVGVCVGTRLEVGGKASVRIESGQAGICDWDAYWDEIWRQGRAKADYKSNGWNTGVTVSGGGTLDAQGKRDGILLCGGFRQTGGSVSVSASDGGAARKLDVWPWLSGYALSANGGFRRDAGTFTVKRGALRIGMKDADPATAGGGTAATCTVAFAANGGSVSPKSRSVKAGAKIGTLPKPTRKGYVFTGWYTAKSGGAKVSAATKITKNTTLYAQWAKKSYKVKFVPNGGKGRMAVQKFIYGKAKKLSANKFKRKGYIFLGWSKTKNGALAYKNKKAVKNLTKKGGTVTLYAQWAKKIYKVKFHPNGGKGKMSAEKFAYGKAKKLSANKFTRKGHAFAGWATSADNARKGAVTFKNGQKVKNLVANGKTVKLYAAWSPVKYAVVFNANGGSVSPASRNVAHGSAIGTLPVPKRGGHDFDGWYTAKSGGVKVLSTTPVTAAMTLWARWTRNDESVDEHEKVQLWEGGPYWATTNIGAEEPEEYGLYFWWGDTVGYRREGSAFVASDGSSQDFCFDPDLTPTYGKDISTLQREGWVVQKNGDYVLAPEHDAAHAHWGGNWRMPTQTELDALNNNCDWTWTTQNGVNGYIVRGRGGYASASIFLPAAGWSFGSSLYFAGSGGYYWSSVSYSDSASARGLFFGSDTHYTSNFERTYWRSVRPVQGSAGKTSDQNKPIAHSADGQPAVGQGYLNH